MRPPDPHAGRMAELDALIARERVRTARSIRCAICGGPLAARQHRYCGSTCSREAMRRRTAAERAEAR